MTVKKKKTDSSVVLVGAIINGMLDKKGKEIMSLNLAGVNSTVCDFFVICHGTSRTHANAIAESVEEEVKKQCAINPGRREGYVNGEWLLIDYLDVVVHIFQEPVRKFYQIEELWADAPSERISES
jgi:ribosome-associated protein